MERNTLDLKKRIARRIAEEIHDGDVINLGIGLPSMVSDFVSPEKEIVLHGENGILGMGGYPDESEINYNVQNAGCEFIKHQPGAMFFDSAFSFLIIRGGHIDATVLGAFQVDQEANLANWIIPGGKISGMGGAMDLANGARKVIVATLHTQGGNPKIVEKCTLPLTAIHAVDMIVTERGVFEFREEGLTLTERFADYTLEEIQESTGCGFRIAEDLKVIESEDDDV